MKKKTSKRRNLGEKKFIRGFQAAFYDRYQRDDSLLKSLMIEGLKGRGGEEI